MDEASINISIIVPAYNEEGTIIQVLERVRTETQSTPGTEIIVVDDGSTDQTAQLVDSRADLDVKLIRQPRNQGKGAAVITGLKSATNDFVLIQDADLEYDPSDFSELFVPAKKFGADIVIGSRLVAPRYTRVHYFWHKLGNRFITFAFNLFFNTTFSDIYSGYLMFKRSLIDPDKLRCLGWGQQAEILGHLVKQPVMTYEVPISYHGRSYGEGKKIKAIHTLDVLWQILRTRLFV